MSSSWSRRRAASSSRRAASWLRASLIEMVSQWVKNNSAPTVDEGGAEQTAGDHIRHLLLDERRARGADPTEDDGDDAGGHQRCSDPDE